MDLLNKQLITNDLSTPKEEIEKIRIPIVVYPEVFKGIYSIHQNLFCLILNQL